MLHSGGNYEVLGRRDAEPGFGLETLVPKGSRQPKVGIIIRELEQLVDL